MKQAPVPLAASPVWRQPWPWIALYGVILAAFLVAPGSPRVVGIWHDDGIYTELGRAILDGDYRDRHTPEGIQVGKYPPGVPLVCAALLAVTDSVEDMVTGVRLLWAALFAGALAAYTAVVRAEGGLPHGVWLLLVAALAVSPLHLALALAPMSEIPSLFLTTLVLAMFAAKPERASWRELAPPAATLAVAVAFRTSNVMLWAALLATLWLSGKRAAALRFLALLGPPVLALQLFVAAHERPAPGFEAINLYELPYGRYLRENIAQLADYVPKNAVQSLASVTDAMFPVLPETVAVSWALAWVAVIAVLVLFVAGLRAVRSRALPVQLRRLYVLFALGLIVAWPFAPSRFLLALAPFVLIDLVHGATRLGGRRLAYAVSGLAFATSLYAAIPQHFVQTRQSFTPVGRTNDLRELWPGLEAATRALPREAVVASSMDTMLSSHIGTRGVFAWDASLVWLTNYAVGRSLGHFYFLDDPLAMANAKFQVKDGVRRQWAKLGVTHALLLPKIGQPGYEILLRGLVGELEKQRRATLVSKSPTGEVELWKIEP